MILKKIKIRNIRSYPNAEVNFPIGSTLIAGSVGAGKSSILMAIEYALFGLQPGQKGTSLLRNKNQVGEVYLALEIAGRQIEIERKLKRLDKGVSNEYAAITIDGEKIESSITEIKSKIVELLGYPIEFIKKHNVLYRFTVHGPQEQMKQIILEDPESRINIVRNIFGIDKYKQIKTNLAIFIADLKNEIKILEYESAQIDAEKENISKLKEKINLLENEIKKNKTIFKERSEIRNHLESELKEFRKKIEETRSLQQEVEKTKILIVTKRDLVASFVREESELKKLLAEPSIFFDESLYKNAVQKITELKKDLENVRVLEAETLGTIKVLKEEHQRIEENHERMLKLKICPTCLQDVSDLHKHNVASSTEARLVEIRKSIEEMQLQSSELLMASANYMQELTNAEKQKENLDVAKLKQDEFARTRSKLESIGEQKKNLESDITLLNQHIAALKEDILAFSIFENKHRKKEQEVKEAALEEKNVEIELASLQKESEMNKALILSLNEGLEKKELAKKKLIELNNLIDWLATQFLSLIEIIERNVLLRLREEFSNRFRKWFLMLIPENTLDSRIDENFTPIIMQSDVEMDYQFLSGGERTAVALAYRLALNQLINSFIGKLQTRGIIILDEPTDGFSETQIVKMRDIFEELEATQLIIVSHEQKIESFVGNIIRVTKERDVSKIETVFSDAESQINQKT